MRPRITVSPPPSRKPEPRRIPLNSFATTRTVEQPAKSNAPKVKEYGDYVEGGYKLLVFRCPGCGYDHCFAVALAGGLKDVAHPVWTWNGSLSHPTFSPSLLCNKDHPESRCHLFVKNGRIQFLHDCFHELKDQTVDMPDWEE